eukprot:SAG31_NODE_16333_length_713_cov_0.938111_1_plen_103_part_01
MEPRTPVDCTELPLRNLSDVLEDRSCGRRHPTTIRPLSAALPAECLPLCPQGGLFYFMMGMVAAAPRLADGRAYRGGRNYKKMEYIDIDLQCQLNLDTGRGGY